MLLPFCYVSKIKGTVQYRLSRRTVEAQKSNTYYLNYLVQSGLLSTVYHLFPSGEIVMANGTMVKDRYDGVMLMCCVSVTGKKQTIRSDDFKVLIFYI